MVGVAAVADSESGPAVIHGTALASRGVLCSACVANILSPSGLFVAKQ
jgi:hypothetical protein